MDALALAHLASAAAYAGFQWTVRVLVYPQLVEAGRDAPGTFAPVEARHQRRTSRLVAPLFAGLVASTALLVAQRPGTALAWACAVCTAAVLAVTALGAVPAHRVLAAGFDAAAAARLVRWDRVRTAAATAQLVLAVVVAASR